METSTPSVEILDWLHEQPVEDHKPIEAAAAAGGAAAVLPWGDSCDTCRAWEDCLMQQHNGQKLHLLQQQQMEMQRLMTWHQEQLASLVQQQERECQNMFWCQTVLHRGGTH
jgi:hypothetical protein